MHMMQSFYMGWEPTSVFFADLDLTFSNSRSPSLTFWNDNASNYDNA
jgi:hypothetical protein